MFRRRRFFRGEGADPEFDDVTWLSPDGSVAAGDVWQDPDRRCLGMLIAAASAEGADEQGLPQRAETVLLLVNAHEEVRSFALPKPPQPGSWQALVDTARSAKGRIAERFELAPYSLALLAWREGG